MYIDVVSILVLMFRVVYLFRFAYEYTYYYFQSNKGYPTTAHREGIRLHGQSPYHRMSYNLTGATQLSLDFVE